MLLTNVFPVYSSEAITVVNVTFRHVFSEVGREQEGMFGFKGCLSSFDTLACLLS